MFSNPPVKPEPGIELREMKPYVNGNDQRLYGWAVKTREAGSMLEHGIY